MPRKRSQITLISFFRFPRGQRRWGMKQMMATQKRLKGTTGLIFHKMLGTGGGKGYSFMPDLSTYALLTVWEDHELAKSFESDSEPMKDFRNHTSEIYSIFLAPIQSRGYWAKKQPFKTGETEPGTRVITVLTRATIKPYFYFHFWRRVGRVSRSHTGRPGLIFTKGLGERPWIMQVTFSVWQSVEAMSAFAHNKEGKHYEAIKTTRKMKGFKEELYARFRPVQTRGSWFGKDPVGEAISSDQKKVF